MKSIQNALSEHRSGVTLNPAPFSTLSHPVYHFLMYRYAAVELWELSFPPAAGMSVWMRVYRLERDARFVSVKSKFVSATR